MKVCGINTMFILKLRCLLFLITVNMNAGVGGGVGCHGGLELLCEVQLSVAFVHSFYVWFRETTVTS